MRIFYTILLLFLILSFVQADITKQAPRKIHLAGRINTIYLDNIEIIVPEVTPVLNFAALELKNILQRMSSINIPIKSKRTSGKFSIVLGDNAISRKAGINVEKLPADGFFIKRKGNILFLTGYDSAKDNPNKNRWAMWFPHGTIFAVYDFLERFAKVRFYFPGEMGTIIPETKNIALPEHVDIFERPDYQTRKYYDIGKWYDKKNKKGISGRNLNLLRNRIESRPIPNCHGLSYLNFIERFGKKHPEYFALLAKSKKRYMQPEMIHTGQLCFTSKVTEEIYHDVKAFLSGKSASERGLKQWNRNVASGCYFNLMPQDWLYWCACPQCVKIAPAGRNYPKMSKVGEFMWKFTVDIAERLKKENIPGYITQMAYSPYRQVPKVEIPDNVLVMTALRGPWDEANPVKQKRDIDTIIKPWVKKLGRKVYIWTYPGKYRKLEMPGIPAMTPKSIGYYFKNLKDLIFGGFIEAETDYYIFNYLNYYVFSKVCWNNNTDIEALLDEHYKLMFGAGAPQLKKFYERLEEIWLNKIAGTSIDTSLGPVANPPGYYKLWQQIYSSAELKRLNKLFNLAEKNTAGSPEHLKRVKFIRAQFLDRIVQARLNYQKQQESVNSWQAEIKPLPSSKAISIDGNLDERVWENIKPIFLRPFKGDFAEVKTKVYCTCDKDNFYFAYHSEEPFMQDIVGERRPDDAKTTYADSCVELLINPSGDRKNYYHLIVNAFGTLYDAKCKVSGGVLQSDLNFASKAQVAVKRNKDSYTVEIALPKNSISYKKQNSIPINFARHRALAIRKPIKEVYYQWSSIPGCSFHALERFGVINIKSSKIHNHIKDGNFAVKKSSSYKAGRWFFWKSKPKSGQEHALDKHIFMTSGKSLYLKNILNGRINTLQFLPDLKPNTRYRLSFYLRTKNLKLPVGKDGGAGAYLIYGKEVRFPVNCILGSTPWQKFKLDFTSSPFANKKGKCSLGLWIWNASGEAWFDDIKINELK